MPSKSMSPMPMQSKIGDASLKFGPDWLRALSSDSTSTSAPPSSPWSGGSGGGGGTPGLSNNNNSPSGPGGGGGGNGFGGGRESSGSSNVVNHHTGGYHQQHQSYTSGGGGGGGYSRSQSYSGSSGIGSSTTSTTSSSSTPSSANRYKPSEFRYSREEILSLYDKNLAPPEFLPAFGTLFIEKMQPPLAFSQPSEEELRVWHIPQPESSRASMGGPPMIGRGGYAIRGRGSAIERGRGRGRGGYYGRPPYEEEERVSFSRPRAFERSLSAHDRAWVERNGTAGGVGQGSSPPDDGGSRGGGSWRNREQRDSYGSKRSDEDDGWRKPRWRRDEEEEGSRTSSSRRLHKSWSEDGAHDNLPEWAKDSTDEREGGTFDASGAFQEEDGYSAKTNAFEKRRREERERSMSESTKEPETHGSHNDRGSVLQKKPLDRNSLKPVIPPSLKEEADETAAASDSGDKVDSMFGRGGPEDKQPYGKSISSSSAAAGGDHFVAKMNDDGSSNRHHHHHHHQQHQQPEGDNKTSNTAASAGITRNSESSHLADSHSHPQQHRKQQQHLDDDPYLDMTEEASSLVAKLIDEDGEGGSSSGKDVHNSSIPSMMLPISMSHSSPNVPNHGSSSSSSTGLNSAGTLGGIDRISPGAAGVGVLQSPPTIDSMETWFYRDPQGNVQGPFRSTEMHQWFIQGYFTGGLLLRRECDKIFITLYEMGKLYDRNPFEPYEPDSPPPPPIIMEPHLSALDSDGNLQAQYQQQQKQQQLLQQQQNMLREQKYLLSMNQTAAMRNEPERWGQNVGVGGGTQPQQQPHGVGGVIGQGSSAADMNASQIQAQMILNLVKNAGGNLDATTPNPIEHLQAIFNRQSQMKGGEPQTKAEFVNSLSMLQSQLSAQMDHQKSQPAVSSGSDAMQSLLHQLTSLSSQQPQQMQKPTMPKTTTESIGGGGGGGGGWGQPFPTATPQMQAQMPWMQQPPNQNSVWEYRDQMMKLQQQKMEEELRRKKLEDEKERKRLMEEEERRQEQKRLELEEEKRKMIEEQLKEKYLLQKKQQEEIMKQQAAELAAARRREEEKRMELEEEKRKALLLQEQLMQKKQEEMMRQHQQEMERQRIAEMQRQQYEQQKLEQQRLLQEQREQQLREEEQRRQQQEHEELQRREREQREEQMRREREEQQRREREEQQRREQERAKFSWNSVPSGGGNSSSTLPIQQTRTLLEIQQEEAVKQQEEIVRQQVLKKKQMQAQQEQQRLQQQNSNFKWAQTTQVQKVQTKSFTEIQAEEAAKLAQQQEKERESRAVLQHHSQQQQMWSSSLTWANRASLNASNASKTNGGGAWGDSSNSANKSMSSASNKSQFPTVQQQQQQQQQQTTKRPTKESEDNLMKLFQDHGMKQQQQQQSGRGSSTSNQQQQQSSQSEQVPDDEFTRWCFTTVKTMASPGMDIPIFINFLKDVESPYEVNDYIICYLGDGRDAREFGKEFLERRSRWRNATKGNKESGGVEDNLCRPASAVNPINSEFQEVKVKGKKGKKGKMQKVDSRILGFTTNADRNKQQRDYGGDSTD